MMFRIVFIVLITILFCNKAEATHIVGGELTYRCLGNNQYEITLIVFRDCYTGVPWFDDPASIGVFNINWQLQQNLLIPLDQSVNDTLPIILSNPCLVAPPDVCVHGTVYKDTVSLPPIPGGYHLVYQRCCRNQLIRNIIDPLDTGASFTAYISDQALSVCNNSAVFNSWPPVAICVNEPIDFDHSATDPDGDSLVYRLCIPLSGANDLDPMPQPPFAGPYAPVTWSAGYSLANVLGGDPLSIDPNTGFLTGIPNTIGNFVVGICVDEYRNGVLISTMRRDFQYNVSDCGQPFAAFFAPEALCDTLQLRFVNQSQGSSTYRWYFDYPNDLSQTSNMASPVHTFPDTGYYSVMLIVEPNDPCQDSIIQEIYVTKTFADANLSISYGDCNDNGVIVQASDQSTDPQFGITGWDWRLTGPAGVYGQSNLQNPEFLVGDPGDYQLRLVVLSGNGCRDTLNLPFTAPVPNLNPLADSLVICLGDTVALFPAAQSAFQYLWTPNEFISSDTVPNPLAYPPQTTLYTVNISGNGPCTAEKDVKVVVLDPGTVLVTADPPVVYPGDPVQLTATYPGAPGFIWEPPLYLDNPNIANPIAYPEDSITYQVSILLSSGCLLNGIVSIAVLFPDCDEPYVFFPTAFSPNNDGENDALKLESRIAEEVYWMVYNRWGQKMFEAFQIDEAWDGTFEGKPQPAETYGYYLRVRCAGGQSFTKKGNVTLLR